MLIKCVNLKWMWQLCLVSCKSSSLKYIYCVLLMLVFWFLTPCGLTGRYQHFVGTYCLHLQGCITSYVIVTQKTNADSFTTVRNSKLILLCIVYVSYVCLHVSFLKLLNGFQSCLLFVVVYTKSCWASLVLICISPELTLHTSEWECIEIS
jgi:hypothetical protein